MVLFDVTILFQITQNLSEILILISLQNFIWIHLNRKNFSQIY